MMIRCPKCGSEDVEKVKVLGNYYLHCNTCKYDEADDLESASNRGGKKGRNVYRTGGGGRSRKK